MSRLRTVGLLLVLCTAQSSCLVCFRCSGCLLGTVGIPVTCARWQDACMKVVMGPWVTKSCTTRASCNINNLESAFTGLVASAVTGHSASHSTYNRRVYCCPWSFCNTGRQDPPTATLTLLAPMLIYLVLR